MKKLFASSDKARQAVMNDDLVVKNYYVGRKTSLAAATGEPRDPPCLLGTALHGFALGKRVLTDAEKAEIEQRIAKYHGRT